MVLLCCSIIFSNCSEVYCGHCGKSEFINLAMLLSLRSTEHRPGRPQHCQFTHLKQFALGLLRPWSIVHRNGLSNIHIA